MLKPCVGMYRLAAEQGHARAQFNLGASYDFGRGVIEDADEAVRWYRLAAEQGEAAASAQPRVHVRDRAGCAAG